tara:strand:- start:5062 stop:5430 length:369 start_codon:yes stop_codon:yes gene_type:complete
MEPEKSIVEINYNTQCIHCKKFINGKSWLSVNYEGIIYNACNYSCGVQMHQYVGSNYWDKIINKEDFNEPRPVIPTTTKVDITTGFDMEEIRSEIEQEEERIRKIEENYEDEYLTSDEDYSE